MVSMVIANFKSVRHCLVCGSTIGPTMVEPGKDFQNKHS